MDTIQINKRSAFNKCSEEWVFLSTKVEEGRGEWSVMEGEGLSGPLFP